MRIYLPGFFFAILITSCFENAEINNPAKELFRTYGKESGINYSAGIEYEFLDSLTLTQYHISLPAKINCGVIDNTQSLLDCFPELLEDIKGLEISSQILIPSLLKIDEYTWVEENYPDVVYSPYSIRFHNFVMFTDVIDIEGNEQQIIRYSAHPWGGTATICLGTLPVKR